ncbi:MAG: hypothetical protein HUK12_00865 [Muribaculaceae bacterium]|nr:hypothetical protein [Muribaculaceae bacterium]
MMLTKEEIRTILNVDYKCPEVYISGTYIWAQDRDDVDGHYSFLFKSPVSIRGTVHRKLFEIKPVNDKIYIVCFFDPVGMHDSTIDLKCELVDVGDFVQKDKDEPIKLGL